VKKLFSFITLVSLAAACTLSSANAQSPRTGYLAPTATQVRQAPCQSRAVRPACNTRVARPAATRCAPRPTRTSTGAPIRYVNVPIPAYARGGGYGYGYGGYGYNPYLYRGGGSGSAVPLDPNSSSYRRSAPRKAPPREAAPPDPRTARDHTYRKLLAEFSRENSLGGRLYLKEGAETWLLEFDGQVEYTDSRIIVPCVGKTEDGFDQPVLLTLRVSDGRIVSSSVDQTS